MSSPFTSAAQKVKTVAAAAAANLPVFIKKHPTFNQNPYATNQLMRQLKSAINTPLAGVAIDDNSLAVGIFVGYTKDINGTQTQTWHPVVYVEQPRVVQDLSKTSGTTSLSGTPVRTKPTPTQIRSHYVLLRPEVNYIKQRVYLDSNFKLITSYLESKYKQGYEALAGSKQGVVNSFKSYMVDSGDVEVDFAINVYDLSKSYLSPKDTTSVILGYNGQVIEDILADRVLFSMSVAYPGYLDQSDIAQHYLRVEKGGQARSIASSRTKSPVFKDQQDFVPSIDFNVFVKHFAPEQMDDFGKVFDYYSDVIIHGVNRSKAEILTSDWKNIITSKETLQATQTADKQQTIDLSAEYENLRLKLLNFVCAFGIKHVHKNNLDIVFYNNDVLEKLIAAFNIPSPDVWNTKREDYVRYANYSWHRYLIAKLLLPSYFIEKEGQIMFPIEAYIHHESVQQVVGKFGAPKSFDEKKIQVELRAFVGALETALEYVDKMSSDDIVSGLKLAIM